MHDCLLLLHADVNRLQLIEIKKYWIKLVLFEFYEIFYPKKAGLTLLGSSKPPNVTVAHVSAHKLYMS